MSHPNELRFYKFIVGVLALSALGVLIYLLRSSAETIGRNFEQTQCNQGLLVAALTGTRDEHQLSFCSEAIKQSLQKG